mmetsp:Transcript_33297/g.59983  ORF Transcript_33297/g.59983 Transcript_33297/m.59983 type:complete len:333 (-) Transcript_33297:156-1154(-)|eukprot:CAMPEP_0201928400 /NCGR_PEP_ID=MMETSP0903-20130614/20783_1 /ASSEMBLY_ACC=CAM_ASM_000552 /TAXON_ID=420261 /ORGANISM="Thalassiosira antarctica, Strain CCMP982" /LENGTH=332 /DNA_ID=CAMNT_0048466851 /DNA_START=88 /DNA_END=1086 /DNA_ORIENTATION=-
MEYNQPLPSPSSPPTLELGEFLDGITFSPECRSFLAEVEEALLDPLDGVAISQRMENPSRPTQLISNSVDKVASKVLQPMTEPAEKKPSEASKPPPNLKKPRDEIDNEPSLVSPAEVKAKDVLCLRGNGGIRNPANMMFRQLISSNKEHFDNLSTQEKGAFATNLWLELHEKGHRFLKQTNSDQYEVLEYELSVRKCHFALRDCRTKNKEQGQLKVATMSNPIDFSQSTKPPKKKQKTGKKSIPAGSLEVRNFDDVARAAISELLRSQELADAMEKNWGDDVDKRKQTLEQQLLKRYQAAALTGLLVQGFSDRLLPVLLKEVGVKNENDDGK